MTETKPEADELRIRSILLQRGVGPDAEPAAEPRHTPDPDGWWDELYADEHPPDRRPAPRIPDWWRQPTTELPDPEPEPEPKPKPEQEPEPEQGNDEPDPEPSSEKPEAEDESPASGRFDPQPGYWPRPHTPAFINRARPDTALSPRTRRLLYNASAATTGWALGLYHPLAAAIADCGQHYSTSGAIVLGTSSSLLIAHLWDRRTRHWWPPLAWCARIPLATTLLALALWAPGT